MQHDTEPKDGSLVLIDANHLAYAYSDFSVGLVKTFSINSVFTVTELDVVRHEAVGTLFNSLVKIDDTHLILAYGDNATADGFIKTFQFTLPTTTLTTLASVKLFLGITSTNDDTLLQSLIDQVDALIIGKLGDRQIPLQTFTNELHDGGDQKIFLNNWPIVQDNVKLVVQRRTGTISNPTFLDFTDDEFVVYE
ncbi:hypothetical protein LCGC14_2393080, partial [marine sediment metagenome]